MYDYADPNKKPKKGRRGVIIVFMKHENKSMGFSVVGVACALVVSLFVLFGGWYAYHQSHRKGRNAAGHVTTSSGPYAGWKTYRLVSAGLSLRYPENWTIPNGGVDGNGIEVNSPVDNGYYFTVALASGEESNLNVNFLGDAPGSTITRLSVPGSSAPLYLVAQMTDATVRGLGLATTPGSAQTSFGILDGGGRGTHNVVMSANLVPAGSSPGVNNSYSLQTYQAQSNYQTVLSIFKSLSYN